jgi:hypothetical protein
LDVDRCTVAVYLNDVYLNDGSLVALPAPAAQPGVASSYAALKVIASTCRAAFMSEEPGWALPAEISAAPSRTTERLIDTTLT